MAAACIAPMSAVTGLAATELTLGALVLEGAKLGAPGKTGVFGWAADLHYLPYVLYLAAVPGIVGHTGSHPAPSDCSASLRAHGSGLAA